jgi:hypothetical protein
MVSNTQSVTFILRATMASTSGVHPPAWNCLKAHSLGCTVTSRTSCLATNLTMTPRTPWHTVTPTEPPASRHDNHSVVSASNLREAPSPIKPSFNPQLRYPLPKLNLWRLVMSDECLYLCAVYYGTLTFPKRPQPSPTRTTMAVGLWAMLKAHGAHAPY